MIDFGRTAADYARHRAGFPDALFDRLARFGIGQPGQAILDLGTGTGVVARALARRGAVVTGVDIAAPMLDEARRLAAEDRLAIHYLHAHAEATGLPAAAFEAVVAGQCWHWFDRPRAAAEALRLLARDGRLAIAHFDWLPLAGNVVEATEALVCAHNPAWTLGGGAGVYPAWFRDVRAAGFAALESFTFDIDQPYTHAAWRGRMRASAGVAATLDQAAVARFDDALAALLAHAFPGDPLAVPHRVFALVAIRP